MEQGRPGWNLEVQAWHVLVLLAVQLLGLGVAYGKIVQAQDQQHDELQRIESQRTITKDDFDEWKTQLTDRINRIENKLDRGFFEQDLGKVK